MTPTTVRAWCWSRAIRPTVRSSTTMPSMSPPMMVQQRLRKRPNRSVEAILGTKESAAAGGHHLKSIGVTWSDHAEASTLRDAIASRGIEGVMLVSDGHAAGALAQAVGRAVGYATTALLFIDRDTATLSVVQTDDGSVVKVLSRSLHSDDAMGVLSEMRPRPSTPRTRRRRASSLSAPASTSAR